jgi:hypothetical protein
MSSSPTNQEVAEFVDGLRSQVSHWPWTMIIKRDSFEGFSVSFATNASWVPVRLRCLSKRQLTSLLLLLPRLLVGK